MKAFKNLLVAALALLSAGAFAAVDVNRASQAELESLKGIGPSLSAKIVQARQAGAFKDWTDLQSRVKGVRERASARLSAEGLTVGGTSYAGAAAPTHATRAPKATKPAKEKKAGKAADAGSIARSAS